MLMLFRRSLRASAGILLLLSCALTVGCSGVASDAWSQQRPKVVPVTGQVLYKGQPIEGATVAFTSNEGTQGATGKTDADGRFQLTTFELNDGAVLGEHKVKISKVEASSSWSPDAAEDVRPQVQQRSLLPARYGDYNTSKLTASVSESGSNEFTFELTD